MTQSPVFHYRTELQWTKNREGSSSGPGLPALAVGAPPEFKGRAGVWTPEQLLVASVNACFMLTFLAIAENSRVDVESFSATAQGKLEGIGGAGYQITEIVLKPTIVIASADDLPRMPRILEKAKANCFISNSVKATVTLEPQIYHRQTPASPCPL